eukprot:CAMPEP_0171096244 /NCGR_PEP_ID=MMETSP0766_2-20121228/43990_1 /TAXON_ID=439317 /ORGANISM="Gambierdiscus australes, Strain CAWD 149" /LENGTH=80 /DNA_ID=CAMNT_0011555171 /DNA_START=8 /DNA_END=250 /DNA_ORIENTATION=+
MVLPRENSAIFCLALGAGVGRQGAAQGPDTAHMVEAFRFKAIGRPQGPLEPVAEFTRPLESKKQLWSTLLLILLTRLQLG